MLKKILVSLLAFSFGSVLTINAADDPSRLRIYSPISASATIESCETCTVTAEGSSLHYVFGFGLGLGISNSKLNIAGSNPDYSVQANSMIDVSYTFGSDFTFTLGYGSGGGIEVDGISGLVVTSSSSSNSLIGLGYNFGGIELLLGMRSVTATYQYDLSYTYLVGGSLVSGTVSNEITSSWNTTDIGIGFTF